MLDTPTPFAHSQVSVLEQNTSPTGIQMCNIADATCFLAAGSSELCVSQAAFLTQERKLTLSKVQFSLTLENSVLKFKKN
jgi:hypothetical protein